MVVVQNEVKTEIEMYLLIYYQMTNYVEHAPLNLNFEQEPLNPFFFKSAYPKTPIFICVILTARSEHVG